MPDGRIGHLGDNCALQCLPSNAKSITAANLQQAPAARLKTDEYYFATLLFSVAVCHFVPKLN